MRKAVVSRKEDSEDIGLDGVLGSADNAGRGEPAYRVSRRARVAVECYNDLESDSEQARPAAIQEKRQV